LEFEIRPPGGNAKKKYDDEITKKFFRTSPAPNQSQIAGEAEVTMSCQTLAKPLVNCWFFFAFLEQKNTSGNCCPSTTKAQLKVNVENMYCRKKKLALNDRGFAKVWN